MKGMETFGLLSSARTQLVVDISATSDWNGVQPIFPNIYRGLIHRSLGCDSALDSSTCRRMEKALRRVILWLGLQSSSQMNASMINRAREDRSRRWKGSESANKALLESMFVIAPSKQRCISSAIASFKVCPSVYKERRVKIAT